MFSRTVSRLRMSVLSTKTASSCRQFCCSTPQPSSAAATDLPGKLSGKVAIVTASTEGIGFGIAENLARHGARVMISSRKVGRGKML